MCASNDRPKPPTIAFLPPLKPHKRLLIALCALFAMWICALAGLYTFDVYPRRHLAAKPDDVHSMSAVPRDNSGQ